MVLNNTIHTIAKMIVKQSRNRGESIRLFIKILLVLDNPRACTVQYTCRDDVANKKRLAKILDNILQSELWPADRDRRSARIFLLRWNLLCTTLALLKEEERENPKEDQDRLKDLPLSAAFLYIYQIFYYTFFITRMGDQKLFGVYAVFEIFPQAHHFFRHCISEASFTPLFNTLPQEQYTELRRAHIFDFMAYVAGDTTKEKPLYYYSFLHGSWMDEEAMKRILQIHGTRASEGINASLAQDAFMLAVHWKKWKLAQDTILQELLVCRNSIGDISVASMYGAEKRDRKEETTNNAFLITAPVIDLSYQIKQEGMAWRSYQELHLRRYVSRVTGEAFPEIILTEKPGIGMLDRETLKNCFRRLSVAVDSCLFQFGSQTRMITEAAPGDYVCQCLLRYRIRARNDE